MSIPDGLERRHDRGEDIGPLLGAVGGGLAGGVLALVVDRLVPTPGAATLVWPMLFAAALGDPAQTAAGLALGLASAGVAAVVFVYGQFRRFVPGPPVVRGIAWGLGMWLVASATLLPRAAYWLGHRAPGAPLWSAIGLVVETAAGMAVYGAVVGVLNPTADDSS